MALPRQLAFSTRATFYELVCSGESLKAAASTVGVAHGTGQKWWRRSALVGIELRHAPVGGLVGTAPSADPGGAGGVRRALTSEDRAVIAAGLQQRLSFAAIGRLIGRDRSVVWRDVQRHRGPDGLYVGAVAHRVAHESRRRPRPFKLAGNPGLCRRIEAWMDQGWSPGLIARMLRAEHGANARDRVSHETIYQTLYVQARGGLRADLARQLSLKRTNRRPRTQPRAGKAIYADAFTIRQRPAEAEDRAVPGHWEGDLIMGAGNTSAVGTLVERSTRFTILLHLPGGHDAATVAAAMIREMSQLPEHLRRSITWDRGTELADYRGIQLALNTTVYFCDPHSPWQRGSNENTNRLLRFWLTKGTDLSVHTAQDLRRIADTLNRRPRPTLDLQTPAQRLHGLLNTAA